MGGKMPVRFLSLLAYCLMLGSVWSACFNKKFLHSLAPAFMFHVLLVFLSGLVFKNLTIGIYGGIALAAIAGLLLLIRNRKSLSKASVYAYCKRMWNDGVFIFLVFYVFCYVINYRKRFTTWDELAHWGMFLKESLRLDSLFCMSTLEFPHKDYVPSITLFETIWCRLNGRYVEADVYRGLQIFLFSMLMPMFERISDYTAEKISGCTEKISVCKYRLFQMSAVLIALLVPLIFNARHGFCFYHSIYCDIAVGLIFFHCVFDIYREHENVFYQLFELTIDVVMLVLAKMTSMALLPLIAALLFVKLVFFTKEKISAKLCLSAVLSMGIPVALWYWFNKFVDQYITNSGKIQSYDGMKISSLKEVFTSPENSAIPYLRQVRNAFVDAVIHRDILLHGSYLVVITFLVIGFFVAAHFASKVFDKRKIAVTGLWAFGSCIYYALLMFFLYCTAFSEKEGVNLASYERYMNSFVISIVFLLLAVYFDSEIWKRNRKGYYWILILLCVDLAFFHVSAFDQVLPGNITHDDDTISENTRYAAVITDAVAEDESLYILKRGGNSDFLYRQRYYCHPRVIYAGSIGPAVNEDDGWSRDLTIEEFVKEVSRYKYIYFCAVDEAFTEKYADAFENPELIVEGEIYRMEITDSVIKLSK